MEVEVLGRGSGSMTVVLRTRKLPLLGEGERFLFLTERVGWADEGEPEEAIPPTTWILETHLSSNAS
jgi:hypothetical protein